jgi:hypothetical protein
MFSSTLAHRLSTRLIDLLCFEQVARIVLIALKRMQLYIEKHPDALEHIAANYTLFDEELIEFLNAKASFIMNVSVCVPATNHFRTNADWALV